MKKFLSKRAEKNERKRIIKKFGMGNHKKSPNFGFCKHQIKKFYIFYLFGQKIAFSAKPRPI